MTVTQPSVSICGQPINNQTCTQKEKFGLSVEYGLIRNIGNRSIANRGDLFRQQKDFFISFFIIMWT